MSIRNYIDLARMLTEAFNLEQFLEKARGVMELVRRGATEGERSAAKFGFERILARAKQEIERMRQPDSGVTADQIDRFTDLLRQIGASAEAPKSNQRSRRPDPPPSVARFKVGQWVIHMDDESVGKIDRVGPSRDSWVYGIRFLHAEHTVDEAIPEKYLRAASQAEVDAAQVRYRAKYKDGDWVVHLDDGSIGKVKVGGVGFDKETMSRWYEIEFVDGASDLIQEKFLRPATKEEIAAAQPKSSPAGDFDILRMASYVDPEMNSDKVYGIVERSGKIYTFWGGNRKALATKQHPDRYEAEKQYQTKIRKGYAEMSAGTMRANRAWVTAALNIRFAKQT